VATAVAFAAFLGLHRPRAAAEPGVRGAGNAPAAAAPTSPPPGFDARTTYLGDCAICHGVDGEGTARAKAIASRGAADVDYELSTGRMPLPPLAKPGVRIRRHPARYSPPEIAALIAYVAGLGGNAGVPIPQVDLSRADMARGGDLYRGQCAACHAWAGDGGALLDRAAPALHDATPTQVAEAVRVGPGTMPAFGQAAFTDEEVDSIVAYVRYLDHPRDRGGNPIWHLGPLAEGLVAWVFGVGLVILSLLWIGESAHSRPHGWHAP
jgi:ubiquinol-cytochrome c reductase cytochrome c subunit